MKKILLIATFAACGLTACVPKVVEKLPYYKMPVVQGTPLDAEAVLSLQTGMTREQVELLIGAPLLRPAFRDNQWDYNYQIMRGGKVKEERNLSIYFNGNVVAKITGSAVQYAREQAKQKGL